MREEKKKEVNYIDLKILKEKMSAKKPILNKPDKEYSESEEDEAWLANKHDFKAFIFYDCFNQIWFFAVRIYLKKKVYLLL